MHGIGHLAAARLILGSSHTRRPSLQPGCHAGRSGDRTLEKSSSAEGCDHFRNVIRHNKPPAGIPAPSMPLLYRA